MPDNLSDSCKETNQQIDETSELPIINCHTHIFTGKYVAPYLARTFLPWPLYFLVSVPIVLRIFTFFRDNRNLDYDGENTPRKKVKNDILSFIDRNFVIKFLWWLMGVFIVYHTLYILFDWINLIIPADSQIVEFLDKVVTWLGQIWILQKIEELGWQIVFVFIGLFFVKGGRNFIIAVFKRIWKFIGFFQGGMTRALVERYMLLGRFAMYKQQGDILSRLAQQYPDGTGFVLLPMDMEYIGAGRPAKHAQYESQMEELANIKAKSKYRDQVYPFVFVDPSRMDKKEEDQRTEKFFKWHAEGNRVVLDDCFIKRFIEDKNFSGFKIYPALGYYPFNEALLPLWKYAADNHIPIMTHCIRGTIFYRGVRKKEWNTHPVFEEPYGRINTTKQNLEYDWQKDEEEDQAREQEVKYGPLLLTERKPRDFQKNFTHPLNYLCLLDESLLRKLIIKSENQELKDLYGYHNDPDQKMDHDLTQLKICFGHFGGEDEWLRFMEKDREHLSNHLIKYPDRGIDFLKSAQPPFNISPGKPVRIWRYVDWYSIICSLMLQYPNIYSDISYILHCEEVFPLLKQTLSNKHLRKKVLYGTDFYVVRNHKSEKQLQIDSMGQLSQTEFDQIARINPQCYLRTRAHK